jgi:HSP20 family protein
MTEITRRAQLPVLSDISGLLDPFQMLLGLLPQHEAYGIRIEAHFEEHAYVVRAELPGIDPDKDVELTVTDGVLTIRAERSEQTESPQHSEFRYGSYTRSLRLPEGAVPDKTSATYQGGILTVRVGLAKSAKATTHKIKVASEK